MPPQVAVIHTLVCTAAQAVTPTTPLQGREEGAGTGAGVGPAMARHRMTLILFPRAWDHCRIVQQCVWDDRGRAVSPPGTHTGRSTVPHCLSTKREVRSIVISADWTGVGLVLNAKFSPQLRP